MTKPFFFFTPPLLQLWLFFSFFFTVTANFRGDRFIFHRLNADIVLRSDDLKINKTLSRCPSRRLKLQPRVTENFVTLYPAQRHCHEIVRGTSIKRVPGKTRRGPWKRRTGVPVKIPAEVYTTESLYGPNAFLRRVFRSFGDDRDEIVKSYTPISPDANSRGGGVRVLVTPHAEKFPRGKQSCSPIHSICIRP